MNDYIKQLEDSNEELQQRLARCEPQWVRAEDAQIEKYFLFFNRCLLAMVSKSDNMGWSGTVYNTLGAVDQVESFVRTPGDKTTLEEAKATAEHIIYSKRAFGADP